jgi:hypothetical protein
LLLRIAAISLVLFVIPRTQSSRFLTTWLLNRPLYISPRRSVCSSLTSINEKLPCYSTSPIHPAITFASTVPQAHSQKKTSTCLTILLKAFLTICLLGFYLLVSYFIFRIGADTLRLCEQLRESFPFLAGATMVVGAMVAMGVFGIATMGVGQAVDVLWKEAPTSGGSADVEMSTGRH